MRKKILIIDDEEDFCYFIRENLQIIGNYTVIVAAKGKKGIQIAERENPDLILLDIMMPGIDGFEILKRLKNNQKTMHIPVVMLTAKNEDEAKLKAVDHYCEDYLVKPVRTEDLKLKIDNVLTRSLSF